MNRTLRRCLFGVLGLVAASLLAVVGWVGWAYQRDPMPLLDRGPKPLVLAGQREAMERTAAGEPRRILDLDFQGAPAGPFRVVVSLPVEGLGPFPVVVVLGGLEVGRESLSYVARHGLNALVACDYPQGPVPKPPRAALGAPGGNPQGGRDEQSGSTRFEPDAAGCRPPPQPEGTPPGGRSAASAPLNDEPHHPAGTSLRSIPPDVVAARGGFGTGPQGPPSWYEGTPLRELPSIRAAALAMPERVVGLMAWLRGQPWADSGRVSLLGYSFGAAFAPACTRLLERRGQAPFRLVMAFGGADLPGLFDANVELRPRLLQWAVGRTLGALVRPLEPSLHLPHLRTEALVILGTGDAKVPYRNARLMHDLHGGPKELLELEAPHLDPRRPELSARVVEASRAWLVAQGAMNPLS